MTRFNLYRNYLEEDDYEDLSTALETFTSIRDLKLEFDSNEMGDNCLAIVSKSYSEYEYLERLELNLNRNDLTQDSICELIEQLESLGMINHVYIQAKKNIRKVADKETIRESLNKLMIKKKKIDL